MTNASIVVEESQNASQAHEENLENELPDKYRGKSAKELVEMIEASQSTIGRQSNEIGTLRKLTDQVLGLALPQKTQPQQQEKPAPLTSENLLADPEESVAKVARREADARASTLEQRLANTEAQLQLDRFSRKYPDFEKTMGTTEFTSWVAESPYRQKLAAAAAQKGDFDAADELFGLYDSVKAEKSTKEKTADPKEAAKAASLAKRGGSSAAGVSDTSSGGKKIYSRSELVNLRINKPEEFQERYDSGELRDAYREGRVRG